MGSFRVVTRSFTGPRRDPTFPRSRLWSSRLHGVVLPVRAPARPSRPRAFQPQPPDRLGVRPAIRTDRAHPVVEDGSHSLTCFQGRALAGRAGGVLHPVAGRKLGPAWSRFDGGHEPYSATRNADRVARARGSGPNRPPLTATEESNQPVQRRCEAVGLVRSGRIVGLDDDQTELIYLKRTPRVADPAPLAPT